MNDFSQPLYLLRCFKIPMSVEVEMLINKRKYLFTVCITDDMIKNSDIDISKTSFMDILYRFLEKFLDGKNATVEIYSIKPVKYEGINPIDTI